MERFEHIQRAKVTPYIDALTRIIRSAKMAALTPMRAACAIKLAGVMLA
jgi:hypothetical protein